MKNIDELKNLKKIIEDMDVIHHQKILEILKEDSIHISSNRNGCFINMNNFSSVTIDKIKNFIHYINNQEKALSHVENIKNDFKQEFFNNNKKDNKEMTTSINETNVISEEHH